MSSQVVVFLGPARSGKTTELLRRYRDVLASQPAGFGRLLWLAPTARAAWAVRDRLMASGATACFEPGVLTFNDLTRRILAKSQARVRWIDRPMQRELLRRLVRSALEHGELEFYAEAARRPGFIDSLAEHLGELKRRDILPHPFAKTPTGFRDARQHQELAQLYADYQQQLVQHRLVDAESAHWAARDALAEPGSHILRGLEMVVADGFTDFSLTQHEILAHLAGQTKLLVIELQSGARNSSFDISPQNDIERHEPARSDLFAKAAETLRALQYFHPQLTIEQVSPLPTTWPAHDYLMRNLFAEIEAKADPPADVVTTLHRFEIVQAAGAQDEIVQIARRIKRLLVEGPANVPAPKRSSPADILVVFRSLSEPAPRVREVFRQFGIPFWLESHPPLSSAAICRALLALLRLDDEDWPFRRVIAVITNNALAALPAPARQAADWLVRDLQIARGRQALLERVEQLATTTTPPHELSAQSLRRIEKARQALPALRHLAEALDALPHEASPGQWAQALQQLVRYVGLPQFCDAGSEQLDSASRTRRPGHLSGQALSNERNDTAQLAWKRIVSHFQSLERLDSWLGQNPQPLSRREVLAALADAAAHEVLPSSCDYVGRVRVLSAKSARGESAKHVFLAGMTEQSFPSPERAGRLYTESDYRQFIRTGRAGGAVSQAAGPVTRSQEEMLLFYGVLACAEETLTISYPALDDKAQSLPPSPYVEEIQRVLDAGRQSALRRSNPQLSPVSAGDTPLCPSEWRIGAVASALSGDCRLLAGLLQNKRDGVANAGAAIEAGLRIVYARASGEVFGPADGMLQGEAAAARFAERFGSQHLWSPSQWETYAACPYKFFVEQVLGLEPLGDLELETDFSRRGSRLHDVLAEFHRQRTQNRTERPVSPADEKALFLERLRSLVDRQLAVSRGGIEAALAELDRRQIRNWAEHYFEQHARYDELWAKLGMPLEPAHFELRFGPARPGEQSADDPRSCNDAFVLTIDGEQVRITGRIDRIDVARIGQRVMFNVIDYKSGQRPSLKADHLATGEHLQLPIYVAAAQALVFDGTAEPLAAGYWTMGGGFDAKGVLAVHRVDETPTRRWNDAQQMVEQRIRQFITAIRRGEFPVFSRDEKCTSRCDFNTICRIAQARSSGKAVESQEPRVKSQKA